MVRIRRATALGLATGVVGFLLSLSPWGHALEENVGLAWLFAMRGPVEPPHEVVVVDIDKNSPDSLGLTTKVSGWPRTLHARLIDTLVRHEASVIVMDLFFGEGRGSDEDAQLAAAITRANRVALFQNAKQKKENIGGREVATVRLVSPIPQLADAAGALGPWPLPKVPTRLSRFWAFFTDAGGPPTLPALALQLHARPAFDELVQLLTRADLEELEGVLQDVAARQRPTDLSRMMELIRREFRTDPQLPRRLLEAVADPAENGLSGEEQQILTALLKLYAGEDGRYLNFYGPPGSIPTIPWQLVLRDPSRLGQPLNLAGKVVFVGASELGGAEQSDAYPTVYSKEDGVDLSGVEIAATAFANLLTDSTLRPAGAGMHLWILLGFGVLAGLLAFLLPGPRAVVAALALGASLLLSAQWLFTYQNLWLPITVPVLLQLPSALFLGLFMQYRGARRAIRHYVPERVAERVEKEGAPSHTPELAFGACLSTDIDDYTSLTERLERRYLASLMNEYHRILREPVERHRGEVRDCTGDSTMCVWTAPRTDKDVRLHACLAALDIQDAVTNFNQRYPDTQLPTRAGLHAGPIALGHVGGSGHFAYHVMGDIVNTTSRIERLNKQLGTRILASNAVVSDLDALLLRPLGSFKLVGVSSPVSIVEIVGQRTNARDARHDLCERFASALAVFAATRWSDAAQLFEAIVSVYPADGPARFYLTECQQRRFAPLSERPLIDLQSK